MNIIRDWLWVLMLVTCIANGYFAFLGYPFNIFVFGLQTGVIYYAVVQEVGDRA